jgi:hypothetical protein
VAEAAVVTVALAAMEVPVVVTEEAADLAAAAAGQPAPLLQ